MKRMILALAFAVLLGVILLAACAGSGEQRVAGGSIGGVSVSANKYINVMTSITVTAGQVVTPSYSFYNLSAAGNLTMTLAGSCTNGQLLYLYGDDDQTITVNDTNIYTTDGNAVTIGQYDLVGWLCNDNKWFHLFKSANS